MDILSRIPPSREYFFDEGCHILELSNTPDDPTVSIARARVEPGVTTRLHRLVETTERYVILEGEGIVYIGDADPLPVERLVLVSPMIRLADEVSNFIARVGGAPELERGLRDLMAECFGPELWNRTDLLPLAPSLRKDAAILHDADDPRVPCGESRELVRRWPGARLLETRGLGHASVLRAPEVAERILDYVTG